MDNIDLAVFASVILISGICMYIFEEKKNRIKRKKKFDEDVEIGLKKINYGYCKLVGDQNISDTK